MTEALTFHDAAYDDEVSAPLIEELQSDMETRYGSRDASPVAHTQFAPPDGAFVVARLGGDVVACAGLRRHDPATVELKRMYVRSSHRRRGLASLLLAELESRARAAGYARLALETGDAQPEAIALYEARGYVPLPGFGHYAGRPLSRAYVKDL